jgi:hypothetical protein
MNLIPKIVWRLIEILLRFPRTGSGFGKWLLVSVKPDPPSFDRLTLVAGLNMERKKNAIALFIRGKVGFHNIMEVHQKLILGLPSFFLPCQVQLSLSLSLFHLKPLTFLY